MTNNMVNFVEKSSAATRKSKGRKTKEGQIVETTLYAVALNLSCNAGGNKKTGITKSCIKLAWVSNNKLKKIEGTPEFKGFVSETGIETWKKELKEAKSKRAAVKLSAKKLASMVMDIKDDKEIFKILKESATEGSNTK